MRHLMPIENGHLVVELPPDHTHGSGWNDWACGRRERMASDLTKKRMAHSEPSAVFCGNCRRSRVFKAWTKEWEERPTEQETDT